MISEIRSMFLQCFYNVFTMFLFAKFENTNHFEHCNNNNHFNLRNDTKAVPIETGDWRRVSLRSPR